MSAMTARAASPKPAEPTPSPVSSISATIPTGNGTYNLNGGVLMLKSVAKGSGTAAFNFGGGTILADAERFRPACP